MEPFHTPIINGLNRMKTNFEFLATLVEGQNLQPTTSIRSAGRYYAGYDENPIQKTLFGKATNELSKSFLEMTASTYAYLSDAYSKENFDSVVTHYSNEVTEAAKVFKNTIEAVKLFDKLPMSLEVQLEILNTGKSAFWNFVASRRGLHQWVKNLSSHFAKNPQEMDYRVKQINTLFNQENKVIKEIFKMCLCECPLAAKALSAIEPPKLIPQPQIVDEPAEISVQDRERAQRCLGAASKEFVIATKKFIDDFEKYTPELRACHFNEMLEEKFQIKEYFSILENAYKIQGTLDSIQIPDTVTEDIKPALAIIDQLHDLFISKKGSIAPLGIDLFVGLLSATVDLDSSRGKIADLVEEKEFDSFPISKIQLYQILAYQRVSSRFTMPIKEMLANAKKIPGIDQHIKKLEELSEFFTLGANLAQKTMK